MIMGLDLDETIERATADARAQFDDMTPEERHEADAHAALVGMRRAFQAGVMWGVNFWDPSHSEDMIDGAFDHFMLAELVNSLEARGVDVSDIDRAVLSGAASS